MKLFLFILVLTLHHIVSAQPGGWNIVTPQELQDNPNIQDLLAWGVQELTQQEASADKLPAATYEYDQVHSIYGQVVSGMNYRFDVNINNDLGWTLRATFVVYNQPWSSTTELTSYVYEVTESPDGSAKEEEFVIPEEEHIPGGYSAVDPSELENSRQLKNALDYGVMAITDQAVSEHRLPESEYEVLEIHSIYEQVVSGMNYRFDVSLQNCAGLVVRAVFQVYSQVWTQTLEATPESLEITETPEEGLVGGDCSGTEVGAGEEESYLGEEEALLEEEDLVGGYTLLDPEEAANDPEIQELQQFGANYVTDEGIKAGRLPDTTYEISNVYSVERQIVSGINYRFDVELRACDGLTARAQYVVYEQVWSGTREVSSYHFDITAAPNGPALAGCPA